MKIDLNYLIVFAGACLTALGGWIAWLQFRAKEKKSEVEELRDEVRQLRSELKNEQDEQKILRKKVNMIVNKLIEKSSF